MATLSAMNIFASGLPSHAARIIQETEAGLYLSRGWRGNVRHAGGGKAERS